MNESILTIPQKLRQLTDSYEQVQRLRIQTNNRVEAIKRGADEANTNFVAPESQISLIQRLEASENQIVEEMNSMLVDHPAWPWLSQIRGIGPTLAGKLLGHIGGVDICPNVAKLWRFAGFAVIDDKAERLHKGEPAHFNRRLKTVCYLVGVSFLRTGSPYKVIYDNHKKRYQEVHPDWTPQHIHLAALRKMIKLFLSHLWETWRVAEGLDVRPPYAIEYLKHTTYRDPWSFITVKKSSRKKAS